MPEYKSFIAFGFGGDVHAAYLAFGVAWDSPSYTNGCAEASAKQPPFVWHHVWDQLNLTQLLFRPYGLFDVTSEPDGCYNSCMLELDICAEHAVRQQKCMAHAKVLHGSHAFLR